MVAFLSFVFLVSLSVPLSLNAFEPPSAYKGLSFGADTSKVYKVFPVSENQKHRVLRKNSGVPGVGLYTLVFPKGVVDSTRLYFLNNHFAMAVEYWYPGADFMDKALKSLTAQYGALVSHGSSYMRRDGDYGIRLTWSETEKRAKVSYFSATYSSKLSSKISASMPDEGKVIDSTLKALELELHKLDSSDSNQ
jgi:hypothetical protein